MTIEKWLIEGRKKKEKKESNSAFEYSEKELEIAKKKKIKELLRVKKENNENKSEIIEKKQINTDDFLNYIIDFKNWLNRRTYLKGDIDKIEVWIKNLYYKIQDSEIIKYNENKKSDRALLREKFKEIPPNFLEEKIRIAINKKLRNITLTNSDKYYLKKLKGIIDEHLKEAKYYEILRKIIEL
ncbi:MAG: hypothetical protein ACTSVV_14815 [Promethearchaeota archaeon]